MVASASCPNAPGASHPGLLNALPRGRPGRGAGESSGKDAGLPSLKADYRPVTLRIDWRSQQRRGGAPKRMLEAKAQVVEFTDRKRRSCRFSYNDPLQMPTITTMMNFVTNLAPVGQARLSRTWAFLANSY